MVLNLFPFVKERKKKYISVKELNLQLITPVEFYGIFYKLFSFNGFY